MNPIQLWRYLISNADAFTIILDNDCTFAMFNNAKDGDGEPLYLDVTSIGNSVGIHYLLEAIGFKNIEDC